jgi:hypothetical protein
MCNDYVKGRCFRDNCRFSHDGAPGGGGGGMGGGGASYGSGAC